MKCYEIRVEGVLSDTWQAWFEGLSLRQEGGQTILTLPASDPALLYGVLAQIGNLQVKLISVQLH